MRWLRSWPAVVPPGRAYVQDDLERLVISNYDYRPLAEINEDVCLLEWDVALDREGMARFERYASIQRHNVLVAPYRLYKVEPRPVWAHRRVLRGVTADLGDQDCTRWVQTADQFCDYFSLGCVYLPRSLVQRYVKEQPDIPLGDHTFSLWHRWHLNRTTPIAWNVQPMHLHY